MEVHGGGEDGNLGMRGVKGLDALGLGQQADKAQAFRAVGLELIHSFQYAYYSAQG